MVQKLRLVTLSRYAHNKAGPFRKGVFLSAYDKARGVIKRNKFQKLASKFLNLHSEMQAVDIAKEVFEKLDDKLGETGLFYDRMCSLNITAYAYLKEMLVNCEEELIVKILKEKFPRLIKLVEKFDEFLEMSKWEGDKPVVVFKEVNELKGIVSKLL